jgi:hypothetical protein
MFQVLEVEETRGSTIGFAKYEIPKGKNPQSHLLVGCGVNADV